MIRSKITIELNQAGGYIASILTPDGCSTISVVGDTPGEVADGVVDAYEAASEADEAEEFERCSCDEALLLRSMLEGTKTWLINLQDNEERCMFEKEGDKLLDQIIEVLDK